MNITITGKSQAAASVTPAGREPNAPRAADPASAPPGDKVTLGSQPAPPDTYGKPRATSAPTQADVEALVAESNRKAQAVVDLILPLVEQQGLNLAKVASGEQKISASPADIEAARAAIADDGELGIEQVAKRILDFAESVIGGDPDKLATVRAAVEDGFAQAKEILGGTLPEISQKTYDRIMATFDQWEGGGAAGSDAGQDQ